MDREIATQNAEKLYLSEFFSVFKSKHKDKDKSQLAEQIDAAIARSRNPKVEACSGEAKSLVMSETEEASKSQALALTPVVPNNQSNTTKALEVDVSAPSPPNQLKGTKTKESTPTHSKSIIKKTEPLETNQSKKNNLKDVLEMKSNEERNHLIFLFTVIWLCYLLTGFINYIFRFLFRFILYCTGKLGQNERLFIQFHNLWIIIQVLITCLLFSLVSHRLITGMLRMYIRLYLSKSLSNNGKFDIHIDWVSFRGILDKNQLVIHNLVWRNPPTHTKTPFLLRIKELTISFEFLQFLSFHRSGRLKAIKFDEIMIDSVEIYFERATTPHSTNSLNVWAAMGVVDKSAEKTMLRSIVKSIMTAIKRRMKQNFTMGLSRAVATTDSDDEYEDKDTSTATSARTTTTTTTAKNAVEDIHSSRSTASVDSSSIIDGDNTTNTTTITTKQDSDGSSSKTNTVETSTTVTNTTNKITSTTTTTTTEKSSVLKPQSSGMKADDDQENNSHNIDTPYSNFNIRDTLHSFPDDSTTILNDDDYYSESQLPQPQPQAAVAEQEQTQRQQQPEQPDLKRCHLHFDRPELKRSHSESDLFHTTAAAVNNESSVAIHLSNDDHQAEVTDHSSTATTLTKITTLADTRNENTSSYNILGFHTHRRGSINNNKSIDASSSAAGLLISSSSPSLNHTQNNNDYDNNNNNNNNDALNTNIDSTEKPSSPSSASIVIETNTDASSTSVTTATSGATTTAAHRRRSSITDIFKQVATSSFGVKKRHPSIYQSTTAATDSSSSSNNLANNDTSNNISATRNRSSSTAAVSTTLKPQQSSSQSLPTVELNRLIIFDLQAYPLDLLSRCHVQQFENASSAVIKVKWFLLTRENVTGKPKTKGGERVPLPADQFGDRFGDAFGQALVTNNSMNIATILLASAAVKTFTTRNTYF